MIHLSIETTHGFIFHEDCILLYANQLPTTHEISSLKNHFVRMFSFGNNHQQTLFCAEIADEINDQGFTLLPLRKALELLGKKWYYQIVRAHAIITWDKNHTFCGRCGNKTVLFEKIFERKCVICKLVFYPRISPSIIVLIQKENLVLLARSHHFTKGAYGLIAGFVEAGETVESALHREVKEEVGIEVKNIQYFGSQPWPFPDSLMLGFFAEYASGELIINQDEIEEAAWYDINHLPGRPSQISIANKMLEHFLLQHKMAN